MAEAVFAARTGTIGISEFPRNMASDSEVSGVDVTATAVHDAPSQGQSMQVDDFSGVDIPSDTQENQEGRDIQGYLESLNRSPTTEISSSSDAEIPEPPDAETKVTGRTPHMGPHRKKQPRRQPPTATKAPGSIGRQARQAQVAPVDRMHMGGALEALLAQDDVEPDETGSHSMASDHYPAVKSGSRASSASGASPRSRAYPRTQTLASTDSLMPPPPPPAPPRHASDPRLHMSDQSLETEHRIERDAIGGALSVKLVSWSEPLKITANHPDVVERNARYLGRLYHAAKVKEPPIMEWTFLANVMQAYTGNKETLFSHVVCMESKQHLFWIHYLREPFSTKAGDSAVHRHTLYFGHGTNTAGVEGIMDSCYLAPATIADGAGAVGHYSQASPWGDSESLKQVLDRVVQSGKWQCPVMVHGFVMTPSGHHVMESGGGAEAQQACMIHAAVHFKGDKKWLLHSDLTTVTSFVIAVKKQFQPLRDHLGRPIFQLGATHADTVKQQVRGNR